MVCSRAGFVALIGIYIYNKIRKTYKNIIIKIFVHLLSVIFMMVGIYLLIATIPSFTSIGGIFISFTGLVIFLTPIGVCTE